MFPPAEAGHPMVPGASRRRVLAGFQAALGLLSQGIDANLQRIQLILSNVTACQDSV